MRNFARKASQPTDFYGSFPSGDKQITFHRENTTTASHKSHLCLVSLLETAGQVDEQ